jgi:HlyD family secretion protein
MAGLLLSACAGLGAGEPTPTAAPAAEPELVQIVADARVLPARSAELRFQISAVVAEVLVAEGETVAAGAPLARLDARDLQLRVDEARASLDQASARYEQVASGATPEEIAAAEASVAQAEASARQAAASVSPQERAAARAELEEARAALARLAAGPRDTEAEQARAALDRAEAELQRQRDGLSAAKTDAELRLDQAANALRNAQDAYSKIYWENNDLRDSVGDSELPRENIDAEAAAERAVADAEAAVEQARVAVERARQDEVAGVRAAEAGVTDARSRLDQLLAGAESDQIAAARARVARAEANLAELSGAEQAGQVQAAAAAADRASAELAQVSAGPRAPDLALARAQVRAAEVALRQAELAYERATLSAPFAGTIMDLDLVAGELPDPAGPAVLLADLSSWRLETSDLTELDVAAVREGATAEISFDAVPDLTLEGVVTRIKGFGESYQGDVIYTVVIEPRSWDDRLRWNMTATVAIVAE